MSDVLAVRIVDADLLNLTYVIYPMTAFIMSFQEHYFLMSWEQLNPPGGTAFKRERWIEAHKCDCVWFFETTSEGNSLEFGRSLVSHWTKIAMSSFQGTNVQLRISLRYGENLFGRDVYPFTLFHDTKPSDCIRKKQMSNGKHMVV